MEKKDYESVRRAACEAVAKFYKEHGGETTDQTLETRIVEGLLRNNELKETGELFLEKKSQYDNSSMSFKQLFDLLDNAKMPQFPNSWIRINLNIEEVVLVVNMKIPDVQPLSLLNRTQVLSQKYN